MEESRDPFKMDKNKSTFDRAPDASQSIMGRRSKRVSFASSNRVKEFTDTSAIMYEIEASVGSDLASSAHSQSPSSDDMELTGCEEVQTFDSSKVLQNKIEPTAISDETNWMFNQKAHPIPLNVSHYEAEPMDCSPIKTFSTKSVLDKSCFSIFANEPEDMEISPCKSFSTDIQSSNHCAVLGKTNTMKTFATSNESDGVGITKTLPAVDNLAFKGSSTIQHQVKVDIVTTDARNYENKENYYKQQHNKVLLTMNVNPLQRKLQSVQTPRNYSNMSDMELTKLMSECNQLREMPTKSDTHASLYLAEDMELTKAVNLSKWNQSAKTPINCTSEDMELTRAMNFSNQSTKTPMSLLKSNQFTKIVVNSNAPDSLYLAEDMEPTKPLSTVKSYLMTNNDNSENVELTEPGSLSKWNRSTRTSLAAKPHDSLHLVEDIEQTKQLPPVNKSFSMPNDIGEEVALSKSLNVSNTNRSSKTSVNYKSEDTTSLRNSVVEDTAIKQNIFVNKDIDIPANSELPSSNDAGSLVEEVALTKSLSSVNKSSLIPNNDIDMELTKPMSLSKWNQSSEMTIKRNARDSTSLVEDMVVVAPLPSLNKCSLMPPNNSGEDMELHKSLNLSKWNQSAKTPINSSSEDMELRKSLSKGNQSTAMHLQSRTCEDTELTNPLSVNKSLTANKDICEDIEVTKPMSLLKSNQSTKIATKSNAHDSLYSVEDMKLTEPLSTVNKSYLKANDDNSENVELIKRRSLSKLNRSTRISLESKPRNSLHLIEDSERTKQLSPVNKSCSMPNDIGEEVALSKSLNLSNTNQSSKTSVNYKSEDTTSLRNSVVEDTAIEQSIFVDQDIDVPANSELPSSKAAGSLVEEVVLTKSSSANKSSLIPNNDIDMELTKPMSLSKWNQFSEMPIKSNARDSSCLVEDMDVREPLPFLNKSSLMPPNNSGQDMELPKSLNLSKWNQSAKTPINCSSEDIELRKSLSKQNQSTAVHLQSRTLEDIELTNPLSVNKSLTANKYICEDIEVTKPMSLLKSNQSTKIVTKSNAHDLLYLVEDMKLTEPLSTVNKSYLSANNDNSENVELTKRRSLSKLNRSTRTSLASKPHDSLHLVEDIEQTKQLPPVNKCFSMPNDIGEEVALSKSLNLSNTNQSSKTSANYKSEDTTSLRNSVVDDTATKQNIFVDKDIDVPAISELPSSKTAGSLVEDVALTKSLSSVNNFSLIPNNDIGDNMKLTQPMSLSKWNQSSEMPIKSNARDSSCLVEDMDVTEPLPSFNKSLMPPNNGGEDMELPKSLNLSKWNQSAKTPINCSNEDIELRKSLSKRNQSTAVHLQSRTREDMELTNPLSVNKSLMANKDICEDIEIMKPTSLLKSNQSTKIATKSNAHDLLYLIEDMKLTEPLSTVNKSYLKANNDNSENVELTKRRSLSKLNQSTRTLLESKPRNSLHLVEDIERTKQLSPVTKSFSMPNDIGEEVALSKSLNLSNNNQSSKTSVNYESEDTTFLRNSVVEDAEAINQNIFLDKDIVPGNFELLSSKATGSLDSGEDVTLTKSVSSVNKSSLIPNNDNGEDINFPQCNQSSKILANCSSENMETLSTSAKNCAMIDSKAIKQNIFKEKHNNEPGNFALLSSTAAGSLHLVENLTLTKSLSAVNKSSFIANNDIGDDMAINPTAHNSLYLVRTIDVTEPSSFNKSSLVPPNSSGEDMEVPKSLNLSKSNQSSKIPVNSRREDMEPFSTSIKNSDVDDTKTTKQNMKDKHMNVPASFELSSKAAGSLHSVEDVTLTKSLSSVNKSCFIANNDIGDDLELTKPMSLSKWDQSTELPIKSKASDSSRLVEDMDVTEPLPSLNKSLTPINQIGKDVELPRSLNLSKWNQSSKIPVNIRREDMEPFSTSIKNSDVDDTKTTKQNMKDKHMNVPASFELSSKAAGSLHLVEDVTLTKSLSSVNKSCFIANNDIGDDLELTKSMSLSKWNQSTELPIKSNATDSSCLVEDMDVTEPLPSLNKSLTPINQIGKDVELSRSLNLSKWNQSSKIAVNSRTFVVEDAKTTKQNIFKQEHIDVPTNFELISSKACSSLVEEVALSVVDKSCLVASNDISENMELTKPSLSKCNQPTRAPLESKIRDSLHVVDMDVTKKLSPLDKSSLTPNNEIGEDMKLPKSLNLSKWNQSSKIPVNSRAFVVEDAKATEQNIFKQEHINVPTTLTKSLSSVDESALIASNDISENMELTKPRSLSKLNQSKRPLESESCDSLFLVEDMDVIEQLSPLKKKKKSSLTPNDEICEDMTLPKSLNLPRSEDMKPSITFIKNSVVEDDKVTKQNIFKEQHIIVPANVELSSKTCGSLVEEVELTKSSPSITRQSEPSIINKQDSLKNNQIEVDFPTHVRSSLQLRRPENKRNISPHSLTVNNNLSVGNANATVEKSLLSPNHINVNLVINASSSATNVRQSLSISNASMINSVELTSSFDVGQQAASNSTTLQLQQSTNISIHHSTRNEDKENVMPQANINQLLTFAAHHLSTENISKQDDEIIELSDSDVEQNNESQKVSFVEDISDNKSDTITITDSSNITEQNIAAKQNKVNTSAKVQEYLDSSRKCDENFVEQLKQINEKIEATDNVFKQIKAKKGQIDKELAKEMKKPFPRFPESIKFNPDEDTDEAISASSTSEDGGKIEETAKVPLEVVPTMEDKIKERETRKNSRLKIVSLESPTYRFSILTGAIHFYAVVDDSGFVQDFNFESKISEKPIAIYVYKMLMERFSHRMMQSALGEKFDIFAFLDYVELNVAEGIAISRQFNDLRYKGMVMDKEFQLTYKVINLKLKVSWEIKINGNELNSITADSISVLTKIGMTKEKDIKRLAENCPRGFSFLTCFVSKLESFVKELEEKKKQGN